MAKQEEFLDKFFRDFNVASFIGENCSDTSTIKTILGFIKAKSLNLDLAKHPSVTQVNEKYQKVKTSGGRFVLNFISPTGEQVRMVHFKSSLYALDPLLFFISPDEITQISRFGPRDESGLVGTKVSSILTSESGKIYRADLKIPYKYVTMYGSVIKELPAEIKLEGLGIAAEQVLAQSFEELDGSFMKEQKNNDLTSVIDVFNKRLNESFIVTSPPVELSIPAATSEDINSYDFEHEQIDSVVSEYNKILEEARTQKKSETR